MQLQDVEKNQPAHVEVLPHREGAGIGVEDEAKDGSGLLAQPHVEADSGAAHHRPHARFTEQIGFPFLIPGASLTVLSILRFIE
jgi:hypothetical protein